MADPADSTPPIDTACFIPSPLLKKPLLKHVEQRYTAIINDFIFRRPARK